jgi:hypothetical protein
VAKTPHGLVRNSLGAETRFVATEHGHANHLDRFEPTLRFLLERLDAAK